MFQPHISYLKNKLDSVLEQLETFESNRVKRGLVDGLGSIIKSVTGNLDYTDAMHYNQALKTLQDSQNTLITEFNSHISLSKNLTTEYSKVIDNIVENQGKMSILLDKISKSEATRDNDLVKYAHLAQVLMILSDNVDSISQELLKLQNNLAFIRTSTMHHSVLNLHAIRKVINRLNILYSRERVLDLDPREYFDIIRLGSYYAGNEIVIVFKFPIVISPIYDMYKLAIVPNRKSEILTPPSPFLALYEKEFKYIEAECPKTSKWYLCEEKQNIQSRTTEDCIQQLITTQQHNPVCQPIQVSLEKPAFEELDEKHYTISFPVPTKVHLSCEQQQYETLQGSYLAIIPQQCKLETPHFTIANINDRLKGRALKIMDLPNNPSTTLPNGIPSLKLNSVNLNNLHEINTKISLQSPLKPHYDVAEYGLYHTTIPMYAVLLSACALSAIFYYRNCYLKQSKTPAAAMRSTEDKALQPQETHALPTLLNQSGVEANQPPAQFTTKVFNSRCSSAGGVTQA